MKRRGFMLWEIAVAMLLLGTLTTLCLELFAAINGQRKDQFAQLAATQEAANVMEHLAAVSWDDLPRQRGDKYSLSEEARRVLPEARVEVGMAEATGTPSARRIAVTVFWRPQLGGPEHKAHVVAWRYRQP